MLADGRAENFKGNVEDKQEQGFLIQKKYPYFQHFIFQIQEDH